MDSAFCAIARLCRRFVAAERQRQEASQGSVEHRGSTGWLRSIGKCWGTESEPPEMHRGFKLQWGYDMHYDMMKLFWALVVDGEAWWLKVSYSIQMRISPPKNSDIICEWWILWCFFPAGCMRISNKFNIRSAVKQWAGLGWIFGVLPGQPVSRKWIYRGQELYPWIRRIHKLGYGFMFLMSKSREVHRCYVR